MSDNKKSQKMLHWGRILLT